ncbi:MAG: aldo/keto reductase family oxidoreductase [Oligoflexales bacterium]
MKVQKEPLKQEGLELSEIIYGTWRIWDRGTPKLDEIFEVFDYCVEFGISSFDLADIYGDYRCEMSFGEILKQRKSIRDKVQLISKAGIQLISDNNPGTYIKHYDTRPEHLEKSVRSSLEKLHTDYLDLFLIHRPDPFMDFRESAKVLNQMIRKEQVRAVGVSNFSPAQFDALQHWLDFPLLANQVEISPLCLNSFDDGTLDHCQKHELKPIAWSPFAGGQMFDLGATLPLNQTLMNLAKKKDLGFDQLVIAWLKSHPAKIIPILGTSSIKRIENLVQSCEVRLEIQEWFEVYCAAKGQEVP